MKKMVSRIAVAGLASAAVIGMVAPTASAESVAESYVAVGSDTLQDVMNALANGTRISGARVRSLANSQAIGSFDATGSANIQTKPYGPSFGRPNGSGDGVKALSRSIDGQPYSSGTPGSTRNVVISEQVDIARSSSGPAADPNGRLLYVPFGRDALSYAYSGNAALGNLSQAQLKALFQCQNTNIGGVQVTPVIPQDGSGSRKDFLKKIGLSDGELGSCVKVGQEHDTSKLSNGQNFPNNAVTPMSVAQWVAQSNGAGIDRRGNGVKIGSPVSGVQPVTGADETIAPNKAFYDTTWGRDTYIVVEYVRVTPGNPTYDPALASLVGVQNATATSLNNTASQRNSAGAVKQKFGFLAPSSTTPVRAKLS